MIRSSEVRHRFKNILGWSTYTKPLAFTTKGKWFEHVALSPICECGNYYKFGIPEMYTMQSLVREVAFK